MPTELETLCEEKGITVELQQGEPSPDMPKMWAYKAILKYGKRRLSAPFFVGQGWTKSPNAADVLSSLVMDAAYGNDSFEDFCANTGYDTDSRQAERIYKACVATLPKVQRFLGADYQTFTTAEH